MKPRDIQNKVTQTPELLKLANEAQMTEREKKKEEFDEVVRQKKNNNNSNDVSNQTHKDIIEVVESVDPGTICLMHLFISCFVSARSSVLPFS